MVTVETPKLEEGDGDRCSCSENGDKTDKPIKHCHVSEVEDATNNKQLYISDESLPSSVESGFSLRFNDEDSIVATEDDVDEEEDEIAEEESAAEMSGWVADSPQINGIQHETANGQVLPSLDQTTFGEVHIAGSQNVRVGNTTLYKGPVTIKQFVYSNVQPLENVGAPDQGPYTNSHAESIKRDSNAPIKPVQKYKVRWLGTWRCGVLICALMMALIILTAIIVVSLMLKPGTLSALIPALDPDDVLIDDIRFVSRVEWGAQPPEDPPEPLKIIPAPYVIISHTASEGCNTQADCVQRVRTAQTMHIEGKGWSDIAYNFLLGGDGLVYIGRDWGITGAHAYGFNTRSVGISFIGTFHKDVPPQRQLHALYKLIEIGIKKNMIAKDYKLLAHRQVSPTRSPGDILYSIIQKHDHWVAKP